MLLQNVILKYSNHFNKDTYDNFDSNSCCGWQSRLVASTGSCDAEHILLSCLVVQADSCCNLTIKRIDVELGYSADKFIWDVFDRVQIFSLQIKNRNALFNNRIDTFQINVSLVLDQ